MRSFFALALTLGSVVPSAICAPSLSAQDSLVEARVGPGRAALLSAVLPGSGQYLLGQRRSWAYAALEAAGWVAYLDRRSAAVDLRARYRDFAWRTARIQNGPRMDGDFGYYETLSSWRRSGRFDADPVAKGVQPEPDAATFNGAIWERANRLFLPSGVEVPESDPRYQRALDYYRARAYGPEFLWDWTGTGDAQEEFASLIGASDTRFRQATNVLGLIVANHVVSMVDAYVSGRIPATTVRSGFVPSPFSGRPAWTIRIDVRSPR
ncbi:MAG: hypothetical protein R3304_08530 [Longimicrobiales bacterium]|nr:hypothetical protein [Longimicrobiales bacterium]